MATNTPAASSTILLREYDRLVEQTDRLPQHEIQPVLYGLFGEVGSIMSAAKKHYRESEAYTGYKAAIEEEFGDAIWYLSAICRRVGIDIDEVFKGEIEKTRGALASTDLNVGPIATINITEINETLEEYLLGLGKATADLLSIPGDKNLLLRKLQKFARIYLQALQAGNISFSNVLRSNINKVQSRFLKPNIKTLPKFDSRFDLDEQLPAHFEIQIVERGNGRSYLRWNGVFIGDPLTDNIVDRDGYRFHDVFHFAHAAVLHWSPVFRALIKQKRKSDPEVDETQDGGRAIVVEEGLTAWVFSRAKAQNFFEDRQNLSFDLLKTISEFVAGYEVSECPLNLWEDAILQGYAVFREVRKHQCGIVIGDRVKRTLKYKSLG